MKEREAPRNLLLCRQYLDAVESGDIEFLQEWILHGRDVNVRLGEGWTALHYAVKRGHIEIVKCLLKTKEIDLNPTTL
jgi:ankyrin repeat protein